jgi:hypothetical protein
MKLVCFAWLMGKQKLLLVFLFPFFHGNVTFIWHMDNQVNIALPPWQLGIAWLMAQHIIGTDMCTFTGMPFNGIWSRTLTNLFSFDCLECQKRVPEELPWAMKVDTKQWNMTGRVNPQTQGATRLPRTASCLAWMLQRNQLLSV